MAGERLLCVSVDLDGPGCYHEIHGLDPPGASLAQIHYTSGLNRLLDLFDELSIKATLFAIGRDLERPESAAVITQARAAGHEIGNHTHGHPYGFTRLDPSTVRDEIGRGAESILAVTGERPLGFRAPGYHLSDEVAAMLVEQGYRYDASLLPSPPYYLAKVGVMAWMRLRGRRSRAVAGHAGMIVSPNRPYRMGRSYWLPGKGLPELPCSVVPVARIPLIGTTFSLAGERRSGLMARAAARMRYVGLEFHAIDMMDAGTDGLGGLLEHQPDVGVELERKERAFRRVLSVLADAGFESMTLEQASRRLFPPQS
jgi:hypothetical protein